LEVEEGLKRIYEKFNNFIKVTKALRPCGVPAVPIAVNCLVSLQHSILVTFEPGNMEVVGLNCTRK
jgi:hypothetical protein